MPEFEFNRIPDEIALTPENVDQFAGWATGQEEYGAPINPVMNDDTKFNSMQNKGNGGTLILYDKNGAILLKVPSIGGGPIYGPDNEPIMTNASGGNIYNKSFPAGAGNHMDASVIDSGTIDINRLPAGIKEVKSITFHKTGSDISAGSLGINYSSVQVNVAEAGTHLLVFVSGHGYGSGGTNDVAGRSMCTVRFFVNLDGVNYTDYSNRLDALMDATGVDGHRHAFSYVAIFANVATGIRTINAWCETDQDTFELGAGCTLLVVAVKL